jgi:hypothetical protein
LVGLLRTLSRTGPDVVVVPDVVFVVLGEALATAAVDGFVVAALPDVLG